MFSKILTSLLQLICIVIAFLTAGLFLKGAFHDWQQTPIITTVDSIAAPIDQIQFPTVTICQDEYKRPDNWAFIETILDNVAFECSHNPAKVHMLFMLQIL